MEECHVGRRFLAIVAFACTKLPLIDCFIEEIPCKSDGPSSTGNTETIVKCLQDILHDISYTVSYFVERIKRTSFHDEKNPFSDFS